MEIYAINEAFVAAVLLRYIAAKHHLLTRFELLRLPCRAQTWTSGLWRWVLPMCMPGCLVVHPAGPLRSVVVTLRLYGWYRCRFLSMYDWSLSNDSVQTSHSSSFSSIINIMRYSSKLILFYPSVLSVDSASGTTFLITSRWITSRWNSSSRNRHRAKIFRSFFEVNNYFKTSWLARMM